MKTKWYIVRKKTGGNWTAFELNADNLPELKKGYEMKGPYNSLVVAFKNSFIDNSVLAASVPNNPKS
ncbi:hypothetical protein ES705_31436 [subsurface metagenome]